MAKEILKVEGFKELESALKELPKATGRNCIRRALTKAADPIVQSAKSMAPKGITGNLKDAIIVTKVRFTVGDAGKQAYAEAMRQGKTKVEAAEAAHEANAAASNDEVVTSGVAIIGVDTKKAFYAHFVEFGTSHSTPKPFLRPAWEKGKVQAAEAIKDILKDEIDKAVERIAKKQARAIAAAKSGT